MLVSACEELLESACYAMFSPQTKKEEEERHHTQFYRDFPTTKSFQNFQDGFPRGGGGKRDGCSSFPLRR